MVFSFAQDSNIVIMLIINFCFIFTLLIAKIFAQNYFCDFDCGKDHTVCARPNCEVGSKCGSNFKFLPFTDEDRSVILALHNERRNYVASGNETRFGNGQASNMNALSYSKELEFVAQCWANNCETYSDICRSTKKFPGHVGQNRKWFSSSDDSNLLGTNYLNDTVPSWYEAIDLTNSTLIDFLTSTTGTLYTQLVWAKTTHIGCGRVAFGSSSDSMTLLIVCDYGSGHLSNEPAYLRGEPCSDCSKCNEDYTSLCGEVEDFTKDTWTPPNNVFLTPAETVIVENTTPKDSTISKVANNNNITEINTKLQNLVEYTQQQEKQLIEVAQQIKSSNQYIAELKAVVDSVIKNNENHLKLVKLQKEILEVFLNNNKS